MPENKEMVTRVIEKMAELPKDTIITIPGYDKAKPYRLHIKEVKNIIKPNITIREAEPRRVK